MVDFIRKRLQIFVSSTFSDLIPERQAAVEAILTAGHIPAGMELFTSGDESQMDVIKQWIDESDVYLLILGGRLDAADTAAQRALEIARGQQAAGFESRATDTGRTIETRRSGSNSSARPS